jgi:hypothetical protein
VSAAPVAASAAMETASAAVETAGAAAAVEPAGAAVEAAASAEATSLEAPTFKAATAETASLEAAAVAASVVAVSTAAVIAVVPRAGADKDATHKVVWTVVAVRRARIWGIPVVAVGANWSRSYITGTDSNANGNLSVGVTCRKHQNAK